LPPTVAGSWFPAQRTVVDAPGGPLQVLHVHLRPMIEGGDPVRGFFSTPPIRRAEIEAYWTEVTADPPRVVAGDFNEEPGGQALAFLAAQGLRRVDAGGPTWEYRGSWRGNDVHLRLALDHVVLDARLAARDAAVLDAGASDHKPVVMTIDQ
jgi:endonuclease/exonuclease/phosphatase family metal-dependent hydrolase